MTDSTRDFERVSWRDSLRPAGRGSLAGWVLTGPRGVVADRIHTATTPLRRMRGLIGRGELGPDESLLLLPCAQVHGFGVRHPFDAVFCTRDLRVLDAATIRPRRFSRFVRGAECCFELRAGRAPECGLEPGAQLALNPKT